MAWRLAEFREFRVSIRAPEPACPDIRDFLLNGLQSRTIMRNLSSEDCGRPQAKKSTG